MNTMSAKAQALKKVVDLLDEEVATHRHELPPTLLNGLAGLSLFYHSYARLTGEEKYAATAEELNNQIIDKLNSSVQNPFPLSHRYSTGLAGIGYTFWHLSKYNFIDFDHAENFSVMDELLVRSAEQDYEAGICDFLHGPIGILYYFIKQLPDRDVRPHLDRLLDIFITYAKRDDRGLRVRNMLLEDIGENEYDLSLAHGLSGILLVLGECIRYQYREDEIRQLMAEILAYILPTEKPLELNKQNSLFPTSVNEDIAPDHEKNLYSHRSRLAWCYGDLNIAWSLIKTGKLLGSADLYNKGLEVGLATTERQGYATHQVSDVYFCHGSSGVAHMYKKLYQETGLAAFEDAYAYWIDQAVANILDDSPLWKKRKQFSVLEGLVGLGFVLLPEVDGKKVYWEELFLLQ